MTSYKFIRSRGITAFFALWIAVSSVFYPIKAHAIFPLPAIGLALVSGTGAVLSSDALLAAGTSLLGAMVVAGILTMPGDNRVDVRIPLVSDASKTDPVITPPSAPSTATPVSEGSQGATPTEGQMCQRASDPTSTGGVIESCSVCVVSFQPLTDGRHCRVMNFDAGQQSYVPTGATFDAANMQSTPRVCPSGYTPDATGCFLSNARVAVPDGKIDFEIARNTNGDGWSYHELPDNDRVDDAPMKPIYYVDPSGKLIIYGNNAQGHPVVQTISPTASGGTTIQTQTQVGGNVRTDTMNVSGSGQITNSTTGTNTGSIDLSGSTPTVSTGTTVTPIDLQIPNDYARSGEAATAANSIRDALDTSDVAGKDAGSATKLEEADKSLDDREKQVGGLPQSPLPDITSFLPNFKPGASVQCSPLVFEQSISHGPAAGLGGRYEMDICPQLGVVREIMGWFFSIGMIWYCWRTFVRGNASGVTV